LALVAVTMHVPGVADFSVAPLSVQPVAEPLATVKLRPPVPEPPVVCNVNERP